MTLDVLQVPFYCSVGHLYHLIEVLLFNLYDLSLVQTGGSTIGILCCLTGNIPWA